MLLTRLLTFPDPRLRTPARPVSEFGGELELEARAMVDVMRHFSGVGLAAPQLGLAKRLIVIAPRESEEVVALANPLITDRSVESEVGAESCLSLPGISIEVPRALAIKLSATDLEGAPLDLEATGQAARILQHEIDHLDGRLIIDSLDPKDYPARLDYLRRLPNHVAGRAHLQDLI